MSNNRIRLTSVVFTFGNNHIAFERNNPFESNDIWDSETYIGNDAVVRSRGIYIPAGLNEEFAGDLLLKDLEYYRSRGRGMFL
jgi:hypothetical protein